MQPLVAPFPWPGGKRRWASLIWSRLGNPDVYAEPFFGSGAVLLARPGGPGKREVVCDANGLVCNFWRAVVADPALVARYAANPTFHHDLTARRIHMGKWLAEHGNLLAEDPGHHDPRIAGWWVWAMSMWIGRHTGFLPTGATVEDRIPKIVPSLSGSGISAQVAMMRGKGPVAQMAAIERHLRDLQDRLHSVIVLNRDWTSCVTPAALAACPSASGHSRAVLLDPPYLQDGQIYESDDGKVARAAYAWAVRNGDEHRVAYCCRRGTFEVPPGWTAETKTFVRTGRGDDMVMFSPACVEDQMALFSSGS